MRAEQTSPIGSGGPALIWSIALLFFLLAPGLLSASAAIYPLARWGDVLDLFTPLVVLPLTWWLLASVDRRPVSAAETVVFVALAALWVEGHSLHLAANALGHIIHAADAADAAELAGYVDEVLSHYIWHAALLGLVALVARRALGPTPRSQPGTRRALLAAGVLGFTLFVITVEGATAPLVVPTSGIVAGTAAWAARRRRESRRPAVVFVTAGLAVALALIAVWAVGHGGSLPEFSEVGIIE